MADYWVSRKRWTCKYCNITINDDVPSRQQHESGLRHKGNVDRALRELYRKGDQERRDQEMAQREMGKIERLAKAAHAKDVESQGLSPVVKPEAPVSDALKEDKGSSPAPPTKWQPTDKYAAYGSGIADQLRSREEAAQKAIEEAARLEKERREAAASEGRAGEWESVSDPQASTSALAAAAAATETQESERDGARRFKMRERTAGDGTWRGDDEEEDDLPALTVRKRIKVESQTAREAREEEARRSMVPQQWQSISLQKRERQYDALKDEGLAQIKAESENADNGIQQEALNGPATTPTRIQEASQLPDSIIKQENSEEAAALPEATGEGSPTRASIDQGDQVDVKLSTGGAGGGNSMFKKRKAGVGAGAKKVKMF